MKHPNIYMKSKKNSLYNHIRTWVHWMPSHSIYITFNNKFVICVIVSLHNFFKWQDVLIYDIFRKWTNDYRHQPRKYISEHPLYNLFMRHKTGSNSVERSFPWISSPDHVVQHLCDLALKETVLCKIMLKLASLCFNCDGSDIRFFLSSETTFFRWIFLKMRALRFRLHI